MRNTPTFTGAVKDGKLYFRNAAFVKAFLKELSGEVDVTIKRHYNRRTDRENRYYWGVVVPLLADHFGYSKDEMHEAIKLQFLKKEKRGAPPTIDSTSVMTTVDFEDFLTKVRNWASMEYGVYIPLPNEGIEQFS